MVANAPDPVSDLDVDSDPDPDPDADPDSDLDDPDPDPGSDADPDSDPTSEAHSIATGSPTGLAAPHPTAAASTASRAHVVRLLTWG